MLPSADEDIDDVIESFWLYIFSVFSKFRLLLYRKFSLFLFGKFLFPTNLFYPSIIIIIYLFLFFLPNFIIFIYSILTSTYNKHGHNIMQ